jgi:hypothetical protein
MNDDMFTARLTGSELPDQVPSYSVLEGFSELSSMSQSVDLKQLTSRDVIRLRTLNSEYRIELIDPPTQRVIVQGGSFFLEPTEAIIRGSTCGGSMLKLGWIVVGLQLEFAYHPAHEQAQSVTTSPVKLFDLECAEL